MFLLLSVYKISPNSHKPSLRYKFISKKQNGEQWLTRAGYLKRFND